MKWRFGFQLMKESLVLVFIVCDVCANINFFLTSKALSLFENDERFKAVDRPRDREDLFDNYIVELERKVIILLFSVWMFNKILCSYKQTMPWKRATRGIIIAGCYHLKCPFLPWIIIRDVT